MAERKTTRKRQNRTSSTASAPAPSGSSHVVFGALWIVVGVILLAYLIYGLILYLHPSVSSLTNTLTGIFPYPAAKVFVPDYGWWFLLGFVMYMVLFLSGAKLIYLAVTNRIALNGKVVVTGFLFVAGLASLVSVPPPTNAIVGYHSYIDRYQSLKTFQDKQRQSAGDQAPPATDNTDDLKASAMNQLVVLNKVIVQEAVKNDVSVSRKEVNDAYKQYADRLQGEDNLKKQLKDFLGWSPSDFKKEIKVKLLQDKLNAKLAGDDKINKDRKEKAEDFLKQVRDQKKDFAEVAKGSDDPTAASGGDQGTVKRGELEPDLEKVVFAANPGDITDIIKTQRGYVIVKVDSKTGDEVKIHQILVKTRSLSEYIPDELKKTHVYILVRDLVWDETLYSVQPKNKPASPQIEASPGAAPASAAPAAPTQ